jgi:riboflavin biosynthesis pyrimidine reductase
VHQLTPNDQPLDDAALAEFYRCPPSQRWVRANFVSTLDGAAQGPDYRSGSISGAADKRAFALLRALADVILVGAGTARAEKYGPAEIRPEFTAIRKAHGHSEDTPPIAVITHSLDLPERLLTDPRTLVFVPGHRAGECAELSERVQVVLSDGDWVDAGFVLKTLDERGYRRISCEGGPRLFAELVAQDLIDELCLTVAPLLFPGEAFRVTRGYGLDQPVRMHLAGLLEDDGYLFSRWLRGPVSQ